MQVYIGRDATGTSRRLVLQRDAHVGYVRALDHLGVRASQEAIDLLTVAAAIYAADRIVRRPRQTANTMWSRELHLVVPVLSPDTWRAGPALMALTALANWMSDDDWTFDFVASRYAPLGNQAPTLLDLTWPEAEVALFSGGLDSAAGAAIALEELSHDPRQLVAVSVATNSRMKAVQTAVRQELAQASGQRPQHVAFRAGLRTIAPENSQRTRGLLFLAVGVAVGSATGSTRLAIYENGIGAINLPYAAYQRESHNTRATHPRTLALFTALAGSVGVAISPVNVYETSTKASMLQKVEEKYHHALSLTASCDSAFTARRAGSPACGACTSCWLRRQSLEASGLETIDDSRSVFGPGREPQHPWEHSHDRRTAMLWQVARLKNALSGAAPWRAVVEAFPELLDLPSVGDERYRSSLVAMYARYVSEWRDVLNDADTRAWFGGEVRRD